jgi:hypothetical protein
VLNFIATEPGKICANLPNETTAADVFELFARVTKKAFEQDNNDNES